MAGAPGIPALLKPATIRQMTTPAAAYDPNAQAKYARGWMVRNNGAGNWWHNGSLLPGSTTIMVRTSTGMCWAALTNTRTQPSNEIDTSLDQMMWNMVRCAGVGCVAPMRLTNGRSLHRFLRLCRGYNSRSSVTVRAIPKTAPFLMSLLQRLFAESVIVRLFGKSCCTQGWGLKA